MRVSFDPFKDPLCRGILGGNTSVQWESLYPDGSVLFFSSPCFHSGRIWEKNSLKDDTLLLIHDCEWREEFNFHVWKVCRTSGLVSTPETMIGDNHQLGASLPFPSLPGEGMWSQRPARVFCKIATEALMPNTNWQGLFIYDFLTYQF